MIEYHSEGPGPGGEPTGSGPGERRVMVTRRVASVFAALVVLAISGCAAVGAASSSGAGSPDTSSVDADSPDPSAGGPPDELADVLERRGFQACFADSIAGNDEAIELSQRSGNLTRQASPELIAELSESMAGCLGTAGVAELITAELIIGGNPVPPSATSCIEANIEGDEVDVMAYYFALARAERPAGDAVEVAAGHLAACVPGSLIFEGQLPAPLEPSEAQCLDDWHRSSPEFAAYLVAQVDSKAVSPETSDGLVAGLYGCTDLAADEILASHGGSDGFSSATRDCVTRAARQEGYLERGVAPDRQVAFGETIDACLAEETSAPRSVAE